MGTPVAVYLVCAALIIVLFAMMIGAVPQTGFDSFEVGAACK